MGQKMSASSPLTVNHARSDKAIRDDEELKMIFEVWVTVKMVILESCPYINGRAYSSLKSFLRQDMKYWFIYLWRSHSCCCITILDPRTSYIADLTAFGASTLILFFSLKTYSPTRNSPSVPYCLQAKFCPFRFCKNEKRLKTECHRKNYSFITFKARKLHRTDVLHNMLTHEL